MSVKYSAHSRQRLQEIMERARLCERPDWIAELILTYGDDRVPGHHKCVSIGMTEETSKYLIKVLRKARMIFNSQTDTVVTVDYPSALPNWITNVILRYGKDVVKVPHKLENIGITREQIEDLSRILRRTRVVYCPETDTIVTIIYPFRRRLKTQPWFH